jgi:protocatechuate 3,4-dioxygenase beta subunit
MPQEFKGRADGSFSMSGVPEGLWVLQVDAEGFASGLSTSIDVRLGQVVTGLEIRISTGGTLTGRVVNQNTGEPIAGARVATQDNGFIDNPLAQLFGSMLARRTTARTAVTDSTGRFALAQLMPGDYQIRIEHNDFTTSIVPNLRVDDSEAPVDFGDFPLREGGAVEGVVYDENGSPLNGATVTLANKEAPGLSYTSRTDEEGRYSIEHVAAGQYVIHAQRAVESTGNPFDVLLDVQNSTREIFVTDAVRQPVDLSLAK